MSAIESPQPMGILFALAIEAGGIVDLLSDLRVTRAAGFTVRQGTRGGRHVVIVESGAGRERAARAAEALLEAHRPTQVICAGFSGALHADLHRDDLVVADSVVDGEGRQWIAAAEELPSWRTEVPGLRMGRLFCADHVIARPAEKHALGAEHQALAVDMESLAVAEVCRARQVPLVIVRVISDEVDQELPADIEKLLAQPTTAGKLGAALSSVWRRPSSVKDLFRLQQNALEASDRLAKVLEVALGRRTP